MEVKLHLRREHFESRRLYIKCEWGEGCREGGSAAPGTTERCKKNSKLTAKEEVELV